MKSLLIEPLGGVAGDMFLSALIDLGLSIDMLEKALRRMDLPDWNLTLQRKTLNGFSACHLSFEVPQENEHRRLSDIMEIIGTADYSSRVVEQCGNIFRRLAEAEAKVHGVGVEQVHFHEVGALDSILDIVGSVLALESLGIDQLWCGPFPYGHGTIRCAHGIIPNPAPATVELLKGWEVVARDCPSELVTPTGAAIVTTLALPTPIIGPSRILGVGYGAGTKVFSFPNLCRAIFMEQEGDSAKTDLETLCVLETHIDDMNPEYLAHSLELARKLPGVLDVFTIATMAKKGRAGQFVQVLCRPSSKGSVENSLFHHTTTLGVRSYEVKRRALHRTLSTIETPHGVVDIKTAVEPDGLEEKMSVEFESVRQVAMDCGLPIQLVSDACRRAWEEDQSI